MSQPQSLVHGTSPLCNATNMLLYKALWCWMDVYATCRTCCPVRTDA
jgi:hypothetical protein